MTAVRPRGRICARTSREARTVTAIHFTTDPVPTLPVTIVPAPAMRLHLLQRLFRWIDDGLAEVDADD
jgi:hypothetical protein